MSEYIKNGLLECGIPSEQILCNPYFTPLVEVEPAIFDNKPKSLVFIGRLVSSKGPHVLIKALLSLLRTRNDICLQIVGDGLMKAELIKMVIDNGADDKIFFHGWASRTEVNKVLSDAYLVYFPSIYPEAFGIAGIEAMMRGKPVIGFNVGGVGTWLEDDVTGYLINDNDAAGLSEKTEILLNDSETYDRMSTSARKRAMAKYTPEIHLNQLSKIYQSALQ